MNILIPELEKRLHYFPMIYKIIEKNADEIDSNIIYDRDFGYDFFGFKTLERSYLLKLNGHIVERPAHVNAGFHRNSPR